jgi:putative polymerase
MHWTPAYVRTSPTPLQWDGSAAEPIDDWGRRQGFIVRSHAGDRATYCFGLMLAVVVHQWVLCLLHTRGYTVSVSVVAAAELLVYAACMPLVLSKISVRVLITLFFASGFMGVLALARGGFFDAKAARDLLIPLLFLWAGRNFGRKSDRLDRVLLPVMVVVIFIGLVEVAIPDLYSRFFNTFSYYVSLGGISASSAQTAGQSVTLNALRPEGIGRTILPMLLGAQRASSVFIEPISLGNFSVILIGYGFSKPASEWRRAAWFIVGALVLITLADSRFGLYTFTLLLLARLLIHGRMHWVAMAFPLVAICGLLAIAYYAPGFGDNLYGRLTTTGTFLLSFDASSLMGVRDYNANFGDMGYCYVISRFSLPGAIMMWVALFALPMHNEAARRFRTSASIYISLILCISGTSLFALKTAGVLWFIVGTLSTRAVPSPAAAINAQRERS